MRVTDTELRRMQATLPATIPGIPYRALLVVGLAGGVRRSELVALDVENVTEERQGLVITVRRSKGDQEGFGQRKAVPLRRQRFHVPGTGAAGVARRGGDHRGAAVSVARSAREFAAGAHRRAHCGSRGEARGGRSGARRGSVQRTLVSTTVRDHCGAARVLGALDREPDRAEVDAGAPGVHPPGDGL